MSPPSKSGPFGWPRFGVVIPVFNNAQTVGTVVEEALLHGLPVLVVDDGSTDGSGERAREAGATVLAHTRNRGKGVALRSGFAAMEEQGVSHAVVLDADGQHHASDLPALVQASRKEPEALVVGVRDLAGDHVPNSSRFGRNFSNWWVELETGVDPIDAQSGFRVYPLHRVARTRPMGKRYDFEFGVLVQLLWGGAPLRTVPIRTHYPPAPERVSHFHWWHDNAWLTWINCRLLILRWLLPWGRVHPLHKKIVADPWGGQRRGSRLGWAILYRGAEVLGLPFVRGVLAPLVTFYLLTSPLARRASVELQRRLFGRRSWWRELTFAWRQLYAFGVCMMDRALLNARGREIFEVQVEGQEYIQQGLDRGRGVILLCSHLGNIELGAMVLANEELPVHQVLHRAEHEGVHAFLAERGAVSGPSLPIEHGDFSALAILHVLKGNGMVAMKADRVVDQRTVTVPFLGADLPFPRGPFDVARITGASLVPVFCCWDGGRCYSIVVGEEMSDLLAESLEGAVGTWAAVLEEQLHRWPDQWFNFYSWWGTPQSKGARSK